ncbi:MAG: YitT family protein [Subdoligranulum sp.]|nr:YitT family protein [Subdoligranulum sp.]
MRNEHQSPQNQTEPHAGRLRALAADLVYDALGSILFALGVYTFAKSADFAPGGVTGLALLLNHLWRWPIGTTTLALNIPIILLSYRVVGRKFLFKSFRTMVISTFFLDLVFPHTPAYTGSPLLAAVFSGVFMGAGLALVYMRGSSTGGTDFLIFTVKKLRPHFSMGQVTLLIDLSVILLGGIFFRNIDALLYGAICTYAQSLVIDKVMYGAGSGKLAIIITKDGPAAARAIDAETSRGATLVRAIGAYSGAERHLVLCACSKSEIFKVRNAVHSIDESAFVMITEASEVFGEGFTPPHEET